MPNTLYLTPYDPAETRAPGELTLDPDARILGVGVDSFAMNVPFLPERTLGGDEVRLMGADGPYHGLLQAGGGGQPMDRRLWGLPGCAPLGVSFLPVGEDRSVTIELGEPAQLIALRARSNGGTGVMTMRLLDASGAEVLEHAFSLNGAMTLEPGFDLSLAPGRYTIETQMSALVYLEQIDTLLPGSGLVQSHLVTLRFL